MSSLKKSHTRILIVDDNEDAANTLGILLTQVGWDVKISYDGPSALKEAEEFHPDVCVLDINMPGMDGYEVAGQLLEQMPENPPVLATLTAREDPTHMDRALQAGFELHFTKPADPLQLAFRLQQCVDEAAHYRGNTLTIFKPRVLIKYPSS